MRIPRLFPLFTGSLLLTTGLLGSRPATGQAFWDPANHHASPGSGGSGNWDTTTSDWWVSGTVDGRWVAGNSATFAGNPGDRQGVPAFSHNSQCQTEFLFNENCFSLGKINRHCTISATLRE